MVRLSPCLYSSHGPKSGVHPPRQERIPVPVTVCPPCLLILILSWAITCNLLRTGSCFTLTGLTVIKPKNQSDTLTPALVFHLTRTHPGTPPSGTVHASIANPDMSIRQRWLPPAQTQTEFHDYCRQSISLHNPSFTSYLCHGLIPPYLKFIHF